MAIQLPTMDSYILSTVCIGPIGVILPTYAVELLLSVIGRTLVAIELQETAS